MVGKRILPTGYSMFMRFLALLALVPLMAACSLMGSRGELKRLSPEAGDFASALAAEYLAYSDSEAEQGRGVSAEYFAAKGLRAAHGEDVVPDTAKTKSEELAKSRGMLVAALTDDVKSVAPQKAARAQLLFDCWVEQESKRISQELAPCRDEFRSTMADLQTVADSFKFGEKTVHSLEFPAGSATLDAEDLAVIRNIAHTLKPLPDYRIELKAYTTSNSVEAKALTEKRISALRSAFIRRGMVAERIKQVAQDESKAVVFSSDEPQGNTVDITVATYGAK
jgi:OOP family OmpA-OmpF porin